MKDYKQFLIDTRDNEKLMQDIKREMKELSSLYSDKTDRELLTIAAKAHGYGFNVLDILNTQVVMNLNKQK